MRVKFSLMNTQRRNTIKEINAAKQSFFHLQNRSPLHNKSSSSKKNRRHFVIHIHSSILDPSSPLKKNFSAIEKHRTFPRTIREHRGTLKLEESCNELSEEALSIHPRYRGGKPAISSRWRSFRAPRHGNIE